MGAARPTGACFTHMSAAAPRGRWPNPRELTTTSWPGSTARPRPPWSAGPPACDRGAYARPVRLRTPQAQLRLGVEQRLRAHADALLRGTAGARYRDANVCRKADLDWAMAGTTGLGVLNEGADGALRTCAAATCQQGSSGKVVAAAALSGDGSPAELLTDRTPGGGSHLAPYLCGARRRHQRPVQLRRSQTAQPSAACTRLPASRGSDAPSWIPMHAALWSA
jgi:hypothetical protein